MAFFNDFIYWVIFLMGCLVAIKFIADGLEFVVMGLIKLAKGVKKWNNNL